MRNPKYKIGDRLKVVKDPERYGGYSDWKIGDYMDVEHIETHGGRCIVYWNWKDGPEPDKYGAGSGLMEEDVELASIADSPLYKALE